MRLPRLALAAALSLCSLVTASSSTPSHGQVPFLSPEQLAAASTTAEKHEYQSDIARLMRVVVSHLYNDRDVFVRELLSNANDALEKVRLVSLTDSSIFTPAPSLNVSVIADAEGGRIVIRDTGIGMTKDQLEENLGTIARSGTSEFLETIESKNAEGANLIGQFGLGFYSSFLVADRVTVASKTATDSEQWIFESQADDDGFRIVKDPRGATLGRGTEITLYLKDDAKAEYLNVDKLRSLIQKHAEYNSAPIFLWTASSTAAPVVEVAPKEDQVEGEEEAEVQVEEDKEAEPVVEAPKWELVNDRPPLWMRDPKQVTEDEYEDFYKKTFKSTEGPLAWSHFKGDAGSTAFRALIYIPSGVPNDFYTKDYVSLESLKLFVKRVFITNDLGPNYLDRHLNWIKVFIDVDDLPLNVGRDSLQKTRALSQIKRNLTKRIYDLFAQLARDDPEKFDELYTAAGTSLKVGAIDDAKNRDRIVKLLRFESSAVNGTTNLDDVVARRKQGQTQIYFIAGAGAKKEELAQSPFVERILARGYEVLYLTEPVDEMLINNVPTYGGLRFQDVAKEGVTFGDEDADEKAEDEHLSKQFEPLVAYLKTALAQVVDKITVSHRLTTSPCVVTAGAYGYSGNMERLIAAQNAGQGQDNFMLEFAKMQKKNFEINPRHPLIERLLEKVEEAGNDEDAQEELHESITVLWQTALLKSQYQVPDPNAYFAMIESMLRRSLGVSQSAKADVDIKPAPPVETGPPPSEPPPPPAFDLEAEAEEQGDAAAAAAAAAAAGKKDSWVDWKEVRHTIKDGVVDIAKAAIPDYDTDVPSEGAYVHNEL